MEISRQSVELFMVSSFLIKNHGYKFVSIKQKENEFWLGNPSNMEFPVIRVSYSNTDSVFFDRNRILEVHNTILKGIKREARLLDIHISDETEVETDADFEQSVINNGVVYGKNITHYFPLIKNAIYRFDDPKTEMANLTRELEDYQSSHKKHKSRVKRTNSSKIRPSYVLIAICVVISFLIYSLGSTSIMETSAAIALGAYFRPMIVVNHQYWRFLTVGLVHIDFFHLLMNMYSLYVIGPLIENVYGIKNFLFLLFFSTISGSLAVFIFGNTELAVGLSGGLYGLMAAYFVFAYTQGLFNNPAFKSSILRLVMINLFINLSPNVSVLAHLGGFVGGLLLSFILVDYHPWKKMKKNMIAALVVLTIFGAVRSFKETDIQSLYYANYEEVFSIYRSVGLDFVADGMIQEVNDFYNK